MSFWVARNTILTVYSSYEVARKDFEAALRHAELQASAHERVFVQRETRRVAWPLRVSEIDFAWVPRSSTLLNQPGPLIHPK